MQQYLPKIIGGFVNLTSYFSSKISAKIAVWIFSKPKKGKLQKEESDYLKGAIHKDLKYDDFHFRTYHWKGNKETVLLIHGWESNSFRWKAIIELLKKEDYGIICIDAPAHGASGSKRFTAILYSECIHIALKTFNINYAIGHSVGGNAIALALNKYNIQSIEKFALLGSPSNFEALVNHYINMMGYNNRVAQAMDRYFLKRFGHLPEYYKASNFLSSIKAEGLIIHDKTDNIISYIAALENKRAYPNAKLIKTVGLGHRLRSQKVYRHILDFLEA